MKNLKTFEKWSKEVKIKSTGENADKSISEINKEITALKKDNAKYKEKGEKIPEKNKTLMSQLIFAKRAKKHWKK